MMQSYQIGNATVCYEPMEEIVRKSDGDPRWCFYCRKRREFLYVVTRPTGESYYGPNPSVTCSVCDTTDGDCFPGRYREWLED